MSVMDMNDPDFMNRDVTASPVQDAEIVAERTPEIVAAEIRQIRDDTLKDYLNSCIEIGKRLCEAKEMVAHGEWAGWLKTAVSFSQRTANNLMKIYEEYGAAQGELWGASAISQTFANLSYSQAVALLAVPAEEREEFVEKNDAANMSTRELQEAIKARDEAIKERDKAREELEEEIKSRETKIDEVIERDLKEQKKLQKDLDFANKKLKMEVDGHNKMMESAKKEKEDQLAEIERLKAELAEAELAAAKEKEAGPSEAAQAEIKILKAKLEEAKKSAGDEEVVRFKILFQNVQDEFYGLMDAADKVKDETAKRKRMNAIRSLLETLLEELK